MQRLRQDAWRLRAEHYPLRFNLRLSWRDVDAYRHVNNVALAAFLEEGRVSLSMLAFGVDAILAPQGPEQVLVAGATLDYVDQCHYPGEVVVASGFSHVGRSSFRTAGAVFQQGRCVALCDTAMVFAVHDKAHPLPDAARASLQSHQMSGLSAA